MPTLCLIARCHSFLRFSYDIAERLVSRNRCHILSFRIRILRLFITLPLLQLFLQLFSSSFHLFGHLVIIILIHCLILLIVVFSNLDCLLGFDGPPPSLEEYCSNIGHILAVGSFQMGAFEEVIASLPVHSLGNQPYEFRVLWVHIGNEVGAQQLIFINL